MSTVYHEGNNYQVHSLIERKKLQWAKEREELAGLNENAPWNTRDSIQLYDRPYIKTGYVTKYQKECEYLRKISTPLHAPPSSNVTPRRQSLPPLHNNKNQNFAYPANEKFDREMGGETSGYGSDNQTQTPDHFPKPHHQDQIIWSANNNNNKTSTTIATGYESSTSGREDRLKWDVVGKYWRQPTLEINNQIMNSTGGAGTGTGGGDTPGWVRRGLERGTELVVANSSPAESPEQDYNERPCTGSSSTYKSHILGQNVRLEASELAERERRRQIAIQHQEAIRQQLEEREKRREEERMKKMQEEYEEERRIARERDLERQRHDQERRQKEEKEERERKRREALKEAIEIAEREAKEEKRKQRMMRQININNPTTNNTTNIANNITNIANNIEKAQNEENLVQKEFKNKNNLEIMQKPKEIEPETPKSDKHLIKTEDLTKQIIEASADVLNKDQNIVQSIQQNISNSSSNQSIISSLPSSASLNSIHQESMALVIQQNPLIESLQNVQFVLIPTAVTQMIPNFQNQNSNSVCDKSANSGNTARTEDRLLTPTQYRNKNKNVCDSSTQTDFSCFERVCEKLSNLEVSYSSHQNSRQSKLRSRSEMRHSETEERPKWGVNRPPTRYLKQSEKDPLYQRRKMRQKMRQIKTYEDKGGMSSDESPTGSPRSYRKKTHVRERGVWRKEPDCDVRLYHTEIIPLECDRDRIYYAHCGNCFQTQNCCSKSFQNPNKCSCNCKCSSQTNKQRFICMTADETEKSSLDIMPPISSCNNNNNNEYVNSVDGTSSSVLDKLTSIHNDLLLKDSWDNNNERSQILYSPIRNS